MRLVQINNEMWVNPEFVQSVFIRTNDIGKKEVCIGWSYGVSEAPAISMVSMGFSVSKYSLKKTIELLTNN